MHWSTGRSKPSHVKERNPKIKCWGPQNRGLGDSTFPQWAASIQLFCWWLGGLPPPPGKYARQIGSSPQVVKTKNIPPRSLT